MSFLRVLFRRCEWKLIGNGGREGYVAAQLTDFMIGVEHLLTPKRLALR